MGVLKKLEVGEFAHFSPGTDRGWRLVKDSDDPRKREWEFVNTKTGQVLKKHKGSLSLGGNLAEWTKGGLRNIGDFNQQARERQQKREEELSQTHYQVENRRGHKRWVPKTQEMLDQENQDNEVNPESSINNEPFQLPGEFPGSREEFDAQYGEENPDWWKQIDGVDMGTFVNGKWQSNLSDADREIRKEFSIFKNQAIKRKDLEQGGNQEYVTDYQTAIRNSRRDGLSFGEAEQYYGEDVLDSAGQRVRKSNVFTRKVGKDGKLGDPLGVMTRKQRLAYDLSQAEAAIPKPDTPEIKKENQNQVTTKETGTIPDTAGTPTGVIENNNNPTTISSFFDPYKDVG